ncbi:hypothetical protein D5086_015257 [Populus alba]|uniref:Uncharacterized protein n=1 Tax=Populus alba TaxID=43335 RepID=A0ACC4C1K9_POPAL
MLRQQAQIASVSTLSFAPVTQPFLATTSSTSLMQLLADPLDPLSYFFTFNNEWNCGSLLRSTAFFLDDANASTSIM